MRCFVVHGGHTLPLWAGHPWVYATGVGEVEPTEEATTEADDVVLVLDEAGRTIGRGLLSERSAIRIRLVDREPGPESVKDVLDRRIHAACELRKTLFPDPSRTNAYRLVHAEGDRLPGLVVDRYADLLVAQFATGPMHARRQELAESLLRASGARALVAREAGYEAEEGIPPEAVDFHVGGDLPARLEVVEEGMAFDVEPMLGQKTGHYTDQRENRVLVAEVAAGQEVLDLYAGTGGFSVQALRRGAAAGVAVESSPRSAEGAERTATLNGVSDRLDVQQADVRHVLKDVKHAGREFGLVILDPPNFFPRRGRTGHALKAYRELNVQALTRVKAGGFLASFACSARFDSTSWRELVTSAARECRRTVRVLRELTAGPDHPVMGPAVEGRYLTGLLVVVDREGSARS